MNLVRKNNLPSCNISDLISEASKYFQDAKSENTKKAYQTDFVYFQNWCENNRLNSFPANPETVALYITYLARAKKFSTIKRALSSISVCHNLENYKNPVKTEKVKNIFDGIKRNKTIFTKGKLPLLLEHIKLIVN